MVLFFSCQYFSQFIISRISLFHVCKYLSPSLFLTSHYFSPKFTYYYLSQVIISHMSLFYILHYFMHSIISNIYSNYSHVIIIHTFFLLFTKNFKNILTR